MENILLEEINRMRRLMNLSEKEEISTDDTLNNDPLKDKIIQSLRQQLGGNKEMYIRLIDNREGKGGKSNIVKQTVNGDIIDIEDDEPEQVNEGSIKDTLKIGAVCVILASGMVSCKKDSYNISNDSQFRLKPSILNSLGKEYFDSPVNNKNKIYVTAGNQTGSGKGNERYLYHDYTNQEKSYGATTNVPDSFASGSNGITPVEVEQVLPFNSEIISKLEPYNKTGKPLNSLLGKYKNVVVVNVLGSSHFDWSDPYKPKEINNPKYKQGHAIYLTNVDGINVGEIYPTMLDVMFQTYKTYNEPTRTSNDKLMGLNDYFSGNFAELLGDKPDL